MKCDIGAFILIAEGKHKNLSIRARYILALSLIAALVSGSALTLKYILKVQQNDGYTINIAGEQRMLSQRIALFVLRLSQCPTDQAVVDELQQSIRTAIRHFDNNQIELQNIPNLSATVKELYFGKVALGSKTKAYVENANRFVDAINSCGPIPTTFNTSNTDALLLELDLVVKAFEIGALERVQRIESIEMFLWFFTLILLVFEAVFIFRPMELKMRTTLASLNASLLKAETAEQRAIHASNAKSEFLAMISHELKTPLNGLLGMMELAIYNPHKSGEYLNKAKRAGKQLLMLINDVLDLSKVEAGKLRLERISFDLPQLLDDITSLQSANFSPKKLSFSYHKNTPLPSHIFGDRNRIAQILHNLLSNAFKFTNKGSVNFEVGVYLKDKGFWLTTKVRDTGVGIAPEKIQAIFNKFEQADQSTTRLFGGSGLGLSIARQLSDLMQGTLTVESKVGEGSCFVLSLPIEIDPKKINDIRFQLDVPKSRGNEKILVVEDDEINSEVVKVMLESAGYQVILATDGEKALEACKSAEYDLIVMDMQMPIMDGITATMKLRKEMGFVNPIIALSANAFDEDRERCIKAGMNAFLVKPVEKIDLLSTIKAQIKLRPLDKDS
jgi:signal transduction histidine kinase/CheY-like chemotaxis protein